MHTILHEELNKFRDEVGIFVGETHSELVNKDKIELLVNRWQQYEEAKCDYITGIVTAVERRVNDVNRNLEKRITETHDNCSYRKMVGDNYFAKADNYVKERIKVASIVFGLVALLLTYNLTQIVVKLDNIDKNFAQFRIDNAKVVAELQLQAKVNAQGIAELKENNNRRFK